MFSIYTPPPLIPNIQMEITCIHKHVFSWNGKCKGPMLVDKEDREWNDSSIPHLPADRLARPLAFPGSRGQNECSSYPMVSHRNGDQWHMHVHRHTLTKHTLRLMQSVWFIARPLGRQSWAVDFVTAQERNNFMDVDVEQQTLTERAGITGNQPWPLWWGQKKSDGEGWLSIFVGKKKAAFQSWADLETVKPVKETYRSPLNFLISDQCVKPWFEHKILLKHSGTMYHSPRKGQKVSTGQKPRMCHFPKKSSITSIWDIVWDNLILSGILWVRDVMNK